MSTELRDRFFTLSAGQAPADEVARYRAEVDATDIEPAATLDGLGISWHPTARHKAVRFVDAERIDAGVRELFARPSETAPYLAAVFVDPHELSFRTFENIVPLDRLFTGAPLDLTLTEGAELTKDAHTFSLKLPADARARLERLDALGLYVAPLNATSRGGERFIFHSALLAEALTDAVTKALPPSMLRGFSHVNPVFRCNRFEPGDTHFHRHRDTPYYDAARQHVSRYTVLLYLTGGSAEAAALDLTGGAALADIEPFTCVIFDQRYEHEGAPYRDGRKVFLRTELIFTGSEVSHDPDIGALFSKACYLTGESVFAPELARHADDHYNRVAAAHWDGLAPDARRETFVHKQFRGVHFVANGYDFWFPKSDTLSLAECAAITLLDYFNCKLGDTAFRTLCEPEVIEAEDTAWIPDFLAARSGGTAAAAGSDKAAVAAGSTHATVATGGGDAAEATGAGSTGEPAVAPFDKSMLFPEPELSGDQLNGACCPFHSMGDWDSTRDEDIVDLYARTQTFAKAHIMPAPILMLGEDVVLDPDKFVVQGDLIHILGKETLTPVNFAACWNSGGDPGNYIDVASTVGVAHFLVPPIIFTESDTTYHLQFDFFRNSWMVKQEQKKVPVPMITASYFDDGDPQPWLDAVDPSLVVGGPEGASGSEPWWAAESPLIDELYDALDEREDEDEDDEEDEDEDEAED